MKKDESFFIKLLKRKFYPNDDAPELLIEDQVEKNIESAKDNEWFQEYEVIYQSYGLE